MAREDLHFRLRIPEDLKAKIEVAAAENRRSMTAEIVARLTESFGRDEGGRIVLKLRDDLLYRMAEAWVSGSPDLRTIDFGPYIAQHLEDQFPAFTFDFYLKGLAKRLNDASETDLPRLLSEANAFIASKWPTLKVDATRSGSGTTRIFIETVDLQSR